MTGRIFTFGCSFTQYHWPTWADIINFDLDNKLYNWGICGIGNIAILHLMLECDLKHQFKSNDVILVNWSSWHREDRLFTGSAWRQGGNIFNNADQSFIDKYWSEHNDIVKNTSAIIMANRMFNINFQSHMIDYDNYTDVSDEYQYLFDELPTTVMFDTENNSKFNNKTLDTHPDVICHLQHVKKIYNSIGVVINPRTVDYYNKLQEHIATELTDTDMDITWNNHREIFSKIISSYTYEVSL
jgi:hypothetical protein